MSNFSPPELGLPFIPQPISTWAQSTLRKFHILTAVLDELKNYVMKHCFKKARKQSIHDHLSTQGGIHLLRIWAPAFIVVI